MGRYRSRSRSRSYTPPRSRTPPRRHRFHDPRDRYLDKRSRGGGGSPAPSGLLVRNIPLDARPEDLRIPFERFGPIKDVYLPKHYYTGEPRGFGFVKFRSGEDAAEAKYHLNHTIIGGREIAIVFAEDNRKTPQEMRRSTRPSGRSGASHRRRSPPRSPRHRHRSYSVSPSPVRGDSRDRNHGARDYYSPPRSQSISRSLSPHSGRDYRSNHKLSSLKGKDWSPREDRRSLSPIVNDRRSRDRRHNGSDRRYHDERNSRLDQRSPSPHQIDRSLRPRSYSPLCSRSRSL